MGKVLAVSVLLILTVTCSAAYAHPPSDIKINFDPGTKMLSAVIMHNTSNPANHYIKKVDVGLNGKRTIGQSIFRQDNNESQSVAYLIPDIKDGDVLSVEGYCSISGNLQKEITVKLEK